MESEWDYLRTIQARHPALAALLVRFNFHPAAYLHQERRSDLIPSLPASLWSVERVHARLSELILRQAALLTQPAFMFPHWGWPLALLSPERVERLSLHLGAIVHGVRIRASLSREHVLLWKEKLGAEAYEFSMTRASLLPPVKDMGLDLMGIPPEQCGLCLLTHASNDMPEGMRIRFVWKLPKQCDGPDVDPAHARRLIRSVLSIVEPEWHLSTLSLTQ